MNNEILQEVMKRLDGIGRTISQGGKAGFEILVRQKFAEGLVWSAVDTFFLIVGIALAIYLGRILILSIKKEKDSETEDTKLSDDEDSVIAFLWIAGAVISVVFILVAIHDLPNNLLHVFNPQYYALKDILNAIKH